MIHWADLASAQEPSAADVEWMSGHLVGRAFREIDGKQGLGHDDSIGTTLGRGRADILIRDFAAYFGSDPSLRNAVRGRVRESIQHVADHVDRILLVAHELGSVIAYEVLTHRRYMPGGGDFEDIGDDLRSRIAFLTLGSPLGWLYDAELAQYVRRSSKTFPRGLGRWTNVYDEKDPMVAPPFLADPTLADDFATFEHNPVDSPLQNPAPTPNSVYGYLSTPPVSELVASFIA